MSLLDCGCGPDTITLGLAEEVVPVRVITIDVEDGQVRRALALFKERKLPNASVRMLASTSLRSSIIHSTLWLRMRFFTP